MGRKKNPEGYSVRYTFKFNKLQTHVVKVASFKHNSMGCQMVGPHIDLNLLAHARSAPKRLNHIRNSAIISMPHMRRA